MSGPTYIEYAHRRRNNRTSERTKSVVVKDVPSGTHPGPWQPCHRILPQQYDCFAAQHWPDLRRGRFTRSALPSKSRAGTCLLANHPHPQGFVLGSWHSCSPLEKPEGSVDDCQHHHDLDHVGNCHISRRVQSSTQLFPRKC